jgi:GGDEF domain-containing protein
LLGMTVSIGVACSPEHGRTDSEVRSAADYAQSVSKERGRDRWTLAATRV